MSFLKSLKANKPTATLEGYFISMLAKSKFGKTTLAIDLAKEHYKGDMSKALLLATEIGYKTMDGVYALNITGFDYAENEDNENEKGFIETVDELIENKADIPFRFIIIDTITALERYATTYAIRKANREDQPQKRYTDISDIPWGKGYNMVAEEIYTQIDRLKKEGFGVFVIGHEKTKKIKNRDGFEYDYTTFNVLTKTSDIIEREADMIIYGDMITEKGADGKLEVNRKLKFRSDGNILCGTRFRHFPSEIENSASAFLEAFKNAVLGLYDNDEKALEKAVKQEESKQVEEKEEVANATSEPEVNADSLKQEIAELLKPLEEETKRTIAKFFKENLGKVDYRKSDDVKGLQESISYIKSL